MNGFFLFECNVDKYGVCKFKVIISVFRIWVLSYWLWDCFLVENDVLFVLFVIVDLLGCEIKVSKYIVVLYIWWR